MTEAHVHDVCQRCPIIQTAGASLDVRASGLLLNDERSSGGAVTGRRMRRGTDSEQHMVHGQWCPNGCRVQGSTTCSNTRESIPWKKI